MTAPARPRGALGFVWPAIRRMYGEVIATGIATFESAVPAKPRSTPPGEMRPQYSGRLRKSNNR